MNYRHTYHAGNFADVVKHATLAMVIEYLALKPAPFRVIDTHAGVGRYDLASPEALKTGEALHGIARLMAAPLPPDIAEMLAPYLSAIASENPGYAPGLAESAPVAVYPGSPLIARHLLRTGDHLIANELNPDDFAALSLVLARDKQAKAMNLDGWAALKSLLPPKERRGVVLIDPPFEEPGELARLVVGLQDAVRRFATGIYILWYPIKDARPVYAFRREIEDLRFDKTLSVELLVRAVDGSGLAGCGMIILNPPFQLKEKLDRLLPFLADRLGQGTNSSGTTRWLTAQHQPTS